MLIWHANLLHGGAPQEDRSRSRHSQVTHYYFENCKYYTPMNSGGWRRQYRDPEWIPDCPLAEYRPPRRSLFRRVVSRLQRL